MRASRRQEPIETWSAMKDKNRDKYVSASHFDHLLNDWQRFTQGFKSAKDYVTQFDEFLIRCSTLVPKSFPDLGLVLEKAYAFVQDLDVVRTNHTFKSHNIELHCLDLPHPPNPIGLVPKPLHTGMTSRARP